MPAKILTAQPFVVEQTLTRVMTTNAFETLIEAPYFSVPSEVDDETAVLDPADAERELRPGQVFFQTPLYLTNKSGSDVVATVQIVREGGAVFNLAFEQVIETRDTLPVPTQGVSLFKRNLALPANAADLLQIRINAANAVDVVCTYSEREALGHAPNVDDLA